MMTENRILVGIITAAHGIKGQAIIRSFTEPATNIFLLPLLDSEGQKVEIKNIRNKGEMSFVCAINHINTRALIEELKGSKIFCKREDLPKLINQDEFYIEDLRNMKVVNEQLEVVGKVQNCLNFGAGDMIEIISNENKIMVLPFTKEIFPQITGAYIVMIMPELT